MGYAEGMFDSDGAQLLLIDMAHRQEWVKAASTTYLGCLYKEARSKNVKRQMAAAAADPNHPYHEVARLKNKARGLGQDVAELTGRATKEAPTSGLGKFVESVTGKAGERASDLGVAERLKKRGKTVAGEAGKKLEDMRARPRGGHFGALPGPKPPSVPVRPSFMKAHGKQIGIAAGGLALGGGIAHHLARKKREARNAG